MSAATTPAPVHDHAALARIGTMLGVAPADLGLADWSALASAVTAKHETVSGRIGIVAGDALKHAAESDRALRVALRSADAAIYVRTLEEGGAA